MVNPLRKRCKRHGMPATAMPKTDTRASFWEIHTQTLNLGAARKEKSFDSGCIQHLVSISAFSSADTNELRKPRLPILAKRWQLLNEIIIT